MTALLGRERELAHLHEALARGGAILLRGEAGIGKSALLAAVRPPGAFVTAGVETETGFPYASLHRLVRPVLGGVDRLAPAKRGALRAALALGDDAAGDPYLVALAVRDLLPPGAVIFADDLQWLDGASRAVIVFLSRHITVIAAVRDGYDRDDLGGFQELHVTGVDREAAEALLAARAALDEELRERLLRVAAGNPLALAELPLTTDHDAAPLSTRLERAFAGRVGEFSPAARSALLMAAADETSTLDELAAAGSTPMALEPAIAAGLVSLDGGRVRFRHPLVRSAVYQSAPLADRLAAHAALADVLTGDRRAHHRATATVRRDDVVADEVEAVAKGAQGRGAVLDAAIALMKAARLTVSPRRRAQRLLHAAELAFEAGRADIVQEAVEHAQQLSLDVNDAARAELLSEIFYDGRIGDVERVHALVADARRVDDTDLALELLRGAAVRCWWGALDAGVRATVVAAAEALEVPAHEPRLLAVLACAAPFERGAEVVARVPAALSADPLGNWFVAMAAHAAGEHRVALEILLELAPTLREHGRFGLLTQVLSMAQWDAVMLGDWETAEASAEEGDRLARETGQPVWGAGLTCGLSAVAAMHGDTERAEALANDAERAIVTHGMADMHSVLITARGIAAVAAGRHDDAFAILRRAFDPADPAYHYREQIGAIPYLAQAAAQTGDDADTIIERVAALAGPGSAPAVQSILRERPADR